MAQIQDVWEDLENGKAIQSPLGSGALAVSAGCVAFCVRR